MHIIQLPCIVPMNISEFTVNIFTIGVGKLFLRNSYINLQHCNLYMSCSLSILHFLNSGDEGSLYMALLIVLMGFFWEISSLWRYFLYVFPHSNIPNMGKLNCNTMFLSVLEIVHSLWHWWHSFHLQFCIYIVTSPPEGVARYCFHPVCLCVCVSVCPANILVFYFSAIRRDIDLKCIQDTYMVVLNSLK